MDDFITLSGSRLFFPADYDSHGYLHHMTLSGRGGDLGSLCNRPITREKKHMQTTWLVAHKDSKTAAYLKKRGWCVMLLSCSTFLLSLWSCSILCFCSSAPSVFPSSNSLDREDKTDRLGQPFLKKQQTFLLSKWWRHNCATSSYRRVFVCEDDVWRVSEKGRWKVGKGAISAPLYTVTQFQSLLSALVRLVLSSPCQSVYRFVFSSMASQRTWCRPEISEVKPTVVRTSTEYFATNVAEITVKAEFPERFGLV